MKGGVGLTEQFARCFPDADVTRHPLQDTLTVSRTYRYEDLARLTSADRTVAMARPIHPTLTRGRRRRLHYGKKH